MTQLKQQIAILICIQILGVALLAMHTPNGAHLSMDSLTYFQTAKHISEGKGLVLKSYDQEKTKSSAFWPPGYSAILAASCSISSCDSIHLRYEYRAKTFNYIFLLLSVTIIYVCLLKTGNIIAASAGALSFVALSSVQVIYAYALSEAAFLVCILALYYCSLKFNQNTSLKLLLLASLFASLSFYLRYIGAIFCICVALFALSQNAPNRQRIQHFLASCALISLLTFPLMIYNFLITGNIMGGDRIGGGKTTLSTDIYATLRIIVEQFFWGQPLLAGLTLLSTAIAVLKLKTHRLWILQILFSAAAYIAMLLASRQSQNIDLDARMLTPIIPALLFTALLLSQNLQVKNPKSYINIIPSVIFVFCTFAFGYSSHSNIVTSVRETGEMGRIGSMTYPNINSTQMQVIGKSINSSELPIPFQVWTDFRRPLVIEYLSGPIDIQLIPEDHIYTSDLENRLWMLFKTENMGYVNRAKERGDPVYIVEHKDIRFVLIEQAKFNTD